MQRQKRISLTLIVTYLIFSSAGSTFGQEAQGEVLVQKDSKLSLELLSPLSTATNQKGDKFTCKVLNPVELSGSLVEGHIRKAKRSGKEKGKSQMDLAFDSITLTDGRIGGVNAQVTEVFDVIDAGDQGRADKEGAVRAKSTVKRDALKIGAGAAIGAIIGGILAGGQGAVIGAAIGAGIGATTTLATRGPDLEFKQGTQFTVVINSPSRLIRTGDAIAVSTVKEDPVINKEVPEQPTLTRIQPPPDTSVSGNLSKNASAPQPLRPAKPNAPSPRYQTYTGNKSFRLRVPANWRESSTNNPVTFAPDRGNLLYQGRPNLTHGIMAGTVATTSPDLQQASNQLVSALLKGNSYLHQQSDYQSGIIAGRKSLSVTLSGTSEVTGETEIVTIYMTMVSNGQMFYLIAVVPQDDLNSYQPIFQDILRSLWINN